MNKGVMVIWGILIFSIWGVILYIGFSKMDKEEIKIDRSVVSAVKRYVKEKNINPNISESIKIFSNDLIEEEYIDKEEIEKECIESVIFSYGILKDKVTINKDCERFTEKE